MFCVTFQITNELFHGHIMYNCHSVLLQKGPPTYSGTGIFHKLTLIKSSHIFNVKFSTLAVLKIIIIISNIFRDCRFQKGANEAPCRGRRQHRFSTSTFPEKPSFAIFTFMYLLKFQPW